MGKGRSDNTGSLNSMLDELISQLERDVSPKCQEPKKKTDLRPSADGQRPNKASQKSKKSVNTAKSLECEECFKEYKHPGGLKNHKCPAFYGILKTETSKSTHRKTVQFAANLENFDAVPFQCPKCSSQFNHRRGFLHHTQKEKCIKNENQTEESSEQSLSSAINALYLLFNNK